MRNDDYCYNGNHEAKNGRCVVDGGRKSHSSSRITRTRPRLNKRALEGLNEVWALANADGEADPDKYPDEHPIWDALMYLKLIVHFDRTSKKRAKP